MNLRLIEGVHERSLVQRVSLGFVTVVCTMCARACDQNLNPGTRTAFRWPTQDLAGIVSMRGEVRGQQMQYMHWCRPVHFIIHALCGRRDKDATNFSRRRLTIQFPAPTHLSRRTHRLGILHCAGLSNIQSDVCQVCSPLIFPQLVCG